MGEEEADMAVADTEVAVMEVEATEVDREATVADKEDMVVEDTAEARGDMEAGGINSTFSHLIFVQTNKKYFCHCQVPISIFKLLASVVMSSFVKTCAIDI